MLNHIESPSRSRRAGLRRLCPWLLRGSGAYAVLGGIALIFTVTSCQTHLPPPVKYQKLTFLDQGWTAEDRATYYHTAQGTPIVPYEWVMALELPFSQELFLSPDNVSRYRLLPDSDSTSNPDRLPVGVTKDFDVQKGVRRPYFGLTCAACHTGQLTYRGTAVRLDGGASQQDLVRFFGDMIKALGLTWGARLVDRPKWERFSATVNALGYVPEEDLAADVIKLVNKLGGEKLHSRWSTTHSNLYPVADGFGRQDALGRGGNNGFDKIGNPANLAVANGPVSYPAVWEAVNWDWVQYNASIQQPLGRNIGEVLGVGGRVTLQSKNKSDLYDSSVNLEGLQTIETTIRKLKAPKWPADVLGAIDQAKAARGAQLFTKNCAGCHDNFKRDPTHPGDWQVRLIPLDEVGTDPHQAANLKNHKINPGDLTGNANKEISAGAVLKIVTDGVAERKLRELYPDEKVRAAKRAEMSYGWENNWRDGEPVKGPDGKEVIGPDGQPVTRLVYRAHSLRGVWATPPYLHNGSVPNMTALLSPVEERPTKFYTGNVEYDPVNLGYETGDLEGGGAFLFSVKEVGNSNAGHEFANKPKGKGVIGRLLTPDERAEIIEYLKTR